MARRGPTTSSGTGTGSRSCSPCRHWPSSTSHQSPSVCRSERTERAVVADVRLVIHGHFYQPPRENPWTEEVSTESSAAPFHDWNERITAECYRPNGWARVIDE